MKILIVDDSIFSQKVTANLLKKNLKDVSFYYANDGEEGYEKYKEIKPDYVFVDLLMPKINGYELVKLIKIYDSAAKIFVVSADVQKKVREEIEKCDILYFANKPFSEDNAKLLCEMMERQKYE